MSGVAYPVRERELLMYEKGISFSVVTWKTGIQRVVRKQGRAPGQLLAANLATVRSHRRVPRVYLG
jgi:hypothetical protein